MLGNFKRYFFLLLFINSINAFVEKPEFIDIYDIKASSLDVIKDNFNDTFGIAVDNYLPEHIRKVDLYNRYVKRLKAEGRQHIKKMQNDLTIGQEEKDKKIAELEAKINIDLRKKHIPLYFFIDPDSKDIHSGLKLSSELWKYPAEGHFIICTTTNVIQNVLLRETKGIVGFFSRLFGFESKVNTAELIKNNKLLYFKDADIVMFVPRVFFELYDLDKALQNYEDKTDALKNNKALLQLVSKSRSKRVEESYSDALFVQNYTSIFNKETKEYVWDIFIVGHGGPEFFIAGLGKNHFVNLLQNLSDANVVGSIFVESCYVGGEKAIWLEKALQGKPLSYHLVLALIGEISMSYSSSVSSAMAHMHDFFRYAAQLNSLKISYDKNTSLTQQEYQERHLFETLMLSMLHSGFRSQVTPHKSEYMPQFMLKGSSHFDSLYNVFGYKFIRSDINHSDEIIIQPDIHTIVFMTSHVKKITLVTNSHRKELYPTFVLMGKAIQQLVIDELYIRSSNNKSIEAEMASFLNSFKNDAFKSVMLIKKVYIQDGMFENLTLNNSVDPYSLSLFNKVVHGNFIHKEQKYDFMSMNMIFTVSQGILSSDFIKVP